MVPNQPGLCELQRPSAGGRLERADVVAEGLQANGTAERDAALLMLQTVAQQ
jgi:hypothetical protein